VLKSDAAVGTSPLEAKLSLSYESCSFRWGSRVGTTGIAKFFVGTVSYCSVACNCLKVLLEESREFWQKKKKAFF
jgi:hypothetical protein